MLDDHAFIHDLDKGNVLGVIAGQPAQLKQSFDCEARGKRQEARNIVVAGMGGSALGAEFVRSWLADRLPLPLVIVRGYDLPGFVGPTTLLIVSSYSGTTEEELSALAAARKTGAQIVVMASGGDLAAAANSNNYPFLELPAGIQPRLSVLFQVKALAVVLESLGLVKEVMGELEAAADWVTPLMSSWTLESPAIQNQAKQIAEHVFGSAAVIYGGPTLAMPARKWKIDFNENGKNVAFWYELPEFAHNEIEGWSHPQPTNLKVIQLQSSLDNPQIQKRFDAANRMLSGQMPSPLVVHAQGKTRLEQMLWTLLLGDFTSAYLAFLNGVDPTPVDLMEKLKLEIAKKGD